MISLLLNTKILISDNNKLIYNATNSTIGLGINNKNKGQV